MPRGRVDRLGPKLLLVWGGLGLGVAFVATPAKFLAPSLTLDVALDVGRNTFWALNRLDLVVAAGMLALGIWASNWRRWFAALLLPVALVVLEAGWLRPALNHELGEVLAGRSPAVRSPLHQAYVVAELLKVAALIGWGLIGGELLSPAADGLREPATDALSAEDDLRRPSRD
jgi:hypothetical protein